MENIEEKHTVQKQETFFNGLNTLRFFAASLVVLMHIRSNQATQGLPVLPDWPIFFQGLAAVSFFFVLSGFLITYILLQENESTQKINIKHFYLKRVFRIWPLYFIVIIIGTIFYWYLCPKLNISFDADYNKVVALLLYLFFGANFMNSLYHVGGILHITWSIAVEEQFYLFWAPIVKHSKKYFTKILFIIFIVSITVNTLNWYNCFHLSEGWRQAIHTLQFHYMIIGGWIALKLHENKNAVLNNFFFKTKIGQISATFLLVFLLFAYKKVDSIEPFLLLPKGLLFAWLIIQVSINTRRAYLFNFSITDYLGKISYGIYMYHMIIVYLTSFTLKKFTDSLSLPMFHLVYILVVFGLTILVSAISFHLFETKIIKWGRSKLS